MFAGKWKFVIRDKRLAKFHKCIKMWGKLSEGEKVNSKNSTAQILLETSDNTHGYVYIFCVWCVCVCLEYTMLNEKTDTKVHILYDTVYMKCPQ